MNLDAGLHVIPTHIFQYLAQETATDDAECLEYGFRVSSHVPKASVLKLNSHSVDISLLNVTQVATCIYQSYTFHCFQ